MPLRCRPRCKLYKTAPRWPRRARRRWVPPRAPRRHLPRHRVLPRNPRPSLALRIFQRRRWTMCTPPLLSFAPRKKTRYENPHRNWRRILKRIHMLTGRKIVSVCTVHLLPASSCEEHQPSAPAFARMPHLSQCHERFNSRQQSPAHVPRRRCRTISSDSCPDTGA